MSVELTGEELKNYLEWQEILKERREREAREKERDLETWKLRGKRTLATRKGIVPYGNLLENLGNILEAPGSRRDRARRAVFKGTPNLDLKQSLCNELSSNMYRDELFELAQELELPILKSSTKKEICDAISGYAMDSVALPVPTRIESSHYDIVPNHLMKEIYDMELAQNNAENLRISQNLFNKLESLALHKSNTPQPVWESGLSEEEQVHYKLSNMMYEIINLPPWLDGTDRCSDCVSGSIEENVIPPIIRAYIKDGGKNPLVLAISRGQRYNI